MRVALFSFVFSVSLLAQVSVGVPGNRVITLAGQAAGTRSSNNGRSAPADSPVLVPLSFSAGQVLQITATGAVDGYGPDGRLGCSDSFVAEFSVARVTTACRALVGVFLADTTRPAPAAGIDFTGDAKNHVIQRPLLQQPFLIGGGVTATGEKKAFVVPAGATRLYLSPVGNPTSTGEFVATVSISALPETPGNPVRVSGVSVINLAAQAAGTLSANNARIAPVHAPAQAVLPLVGGQVLRIVATGTVETEGPEGRTGCTDSFTAEFSIARVDTRCRALVGVFLADTTRAQPPNLNFTGATRNTVRVEPLIQQPFLVGSGYTDAGEMKQFVVPAGATRLYFASMGSPTTAGFFTVTVSPVGGSTPVLERTGVVRAAGFQAGPVAAGGIAAAFGSAFADSTESASSVPLPRQIGQTRVYVNLRPAPLYFTSSGQVNFQVPWEMAGETGAQIVVVRNGAASLPVPMELGAASPGIFLVSDGVGVVVNGATNQLVTAAAPARAGDTLVIYASGLGPVAAEAVSGAPASSTTLEPTQAPVGATLGGVALQVVFAGSAPGFIGVNQVNAVIPAEARTGRLKLSTRGVDSNEVQVVVQ